MAADSALARLNERQFSQTVEDLAHKLGWLSYHTFLSIRSTPGFPDLVLVRPPRVLFVELKRESGRVTDPQALWLASLAQCPGVEAYLWRPSDIESIERIVR